MSPLAERPPHTVDGAEMLAEIEDELAFRRTVYARQVDRNAMKADDALEMIATMEAIRDDLTSAYDAATETWPGRRVGWRVKVKELRRELAIRRGSWPKRVANPADPLDKATAARRLERLDAVHFRYWMELFGADDEFIGPPQVRYDKTRAWHYVRWLWMRDALNRGGRDALCVTPDFRRFADALHERNPGAVSIWRDYRAAAERNNMLAHIPAVSGT